MAEKYFSKSIGFKKPVDIEGVECYYQAIDTPWELVQGEYKIPHVDYRFKKGIVTIPAMVYLNTPEQCSGGTAFYRHVKTGIYKIDSTSQFHSVYADMDSDWAMYDFIDMKYNRLVMYNGNLMHTAHIKNNAFGTTMEDCRLTQNIFLHVKI